ncbi:MAG: hypothetical protein KJZ78_07220 [Bryobacteraceae bacterium]|nr:hypothetical protein [Bryobacteraceae bacterium]HEU0140754.1 hypothetical protein [Bryobacteraceae bacterium]
MDPTQTLLGVLMRWIHITSVVFVVGGMLYARLILLPAMARLSPQDRQSMTDRLAAYLSPWAWAAMAAIVGSGLYNFFTKAGYPPGYHMWFGIKILLALHVFAVLMLLTKSGGDERKRARWMTGVIISALIVIAISAWLRWISVPAVPA